MVLSNHDYVCMMLMRVHEIVLKSKCFWYFKVILKIYLDYSYKWDTICEILHEVFVKWQWQIWE